MGHRYMTNSVQVFEVDQDQNRYHINSDESYIHSGRAMDPGNGFYAHHLENVLTGEVNSSSQLNLDIMTREHSLSSFGGQRPYFQTAIPGQSYDPLPHLAATGSSYRAPEGNVSHGHTAYHNRNTIHGAEEGGLLGPAMHSSRGPFKRKSPSISIAYEHGSTSRFYGAGSSSGSSDFHMDEPTFDHRTYFCGPTGLSHYGGSSPPISGDASLRNVRRRSRFEMEPNQTTAHLPSYSSQHFHPTPHLITHSNGVDLANSTADATTYERSHVAVPPAVQGRYMNPETNGLSYETNRFVIGRNTVEIGPHHYSSFSSRNPDSLRQYYHAHPAQAVREGHNDYGPRSMPSYGTGLSYPHLGWEAAHSENGFQSLSETFSSRYPRPFSAGGWPNSHRNDRSRISGERYQPLSYAAVTHDRMESETFLMVDHSSLYGSRNLFDQYGDMRLDIDDMSYEELLALGESIGNVSTGLSEDMFSKCVSRKTYHSLDQDQEEAVCTICLEEYNKEEVVTMRNCGHYYHLGCIKKWLSMKNSCPICKAPALADSLKGE